MRAGGAVPGQADLGVDGAIRLCRDEVEAADMGGGDEGAIPEPGRANAVRVHVDEDLTAALPGLGQATGLHHLAEGTDRNVAVGTVVRPGDHLDRDERANRARPSDRRTRGDHRAAGVEHHPHLVLRRGDRGLIDEPEQAAAVTGRLLRGQVGRRNVGDHVEGHTAVRAQRDGDLILHLVQVGHEQVSVLIEGQARIAARVAQLIARAAADQLPRPRGTTVETHPLEHPRGDPCLDVAHVGDRHDVVRVRGIDRDGFLRLVQMPLADIDIGRRRPCRDRRPRWNQQRRGHRCRRVEEDVPGPSVVRGHENEKVPSGGQV